MKERRERERDGADGEVKEKRREREEKRAEKSGNGLLAAPLVVVHEEALLSLVDVNLLNLSGEREREREKAYVSCM